MVKRLLLEKKKTYNERIKIVVLILLGFFEVVCKAVYVPYPCPGSLERLKRNSIFHDTKIRAMMPWKIEENIAL